MDWIDLQYLSVVSMLELSRNVVVACYAAADDSLVVVIDVRASVMGFEVGRPANLEKPDLSKTADLPTWQTGRNPCRTVRFLVYVLSFD
jgi:hypothetical protein